MRFRPTRLEGFLVIELDLHVDERGSFGRAFCADEFKSAGIPFEVVQTNISLNPHRHTLRGMHYQQPPNGEPKVVLCTHGRIFDVAVDLRPDSPTYLQWEAVQLELGEGVARAVYIAPGLAHGFLTLEPDSDVYYLMGAVYVPGSGRGVRWHDPAIGIIWPAPPAVISPKDATYPLVAV
jgi:dTDP-4-dehydrorhamnose 3,5-epimerase